MVTDNECREVARRLREYVDLPDDWWADTYSGFYVEKCAFGNVERHRESELFARLADLIEPDSTIPTDPGEAALASVEGFVREMRHSTEEEQNEYDAMLKKMSVELYPVDRDALLAVADALSGDYRYEGNSIAAKQVVDVFNKEHHKFARRICKAIGNGV